MTKKTITKNKTKIIVGTALIAALGILAFAFTVSIKKGTVRTATTEDVETNIDIAVNDLLIPNTIIDTIDFTVYNDTEKMDDEELIDENVRDKFPRVHLEVWLEDAKLYLDFTNTEFDLNNFLVSSSKINSNFEMPEVKVKGTLDIKATHGKGVTTISLLDVEQDFTLTGVSGDADFGVEIDSTGALTTTGLNLSDIEFDTFETDWDDLGWFEKFKEKIGANAGLSCGVTITDSIEQLDECFKKEVQKKVNKNKKIHKKLEKAIDKEIADALAEPYYLTADTSASNIFSSVTSSLDEVLISDNFAVTTGTQLTPTNTTKNCGSDVTVASNKSSLSSPYQANGDLMVSMPYAFLQTMAEYYFQAGTICPEDIPIKDSSLNVDLLAAIKLKDSTTISPENYETTVVEIQLNNTSGGKADTIKSIAVGTEENEGISLSTPIQATISGTVGTTSIHETIDGEVMIIGDINTDEDGALSITVRNMIVTDLDLPTKVTRIISKPVVLDYINTELAKDYWHKKIITSSYIAECFLEPATYIQSINSVDCTNCVLSTGLKMNDLGAAYNLDLYNETEATYYEDGLTLDLFLQGEDDDCDETIFIGDLANSRIDDMIEGGRIHEEITQIQIWTASQTAAELRTQVETWTETWKKYLDVENYSAIEQYPWNDYATMQKTQF